MKPLFPIVVAILVIAANAHPDNIEGVKELPQTKEIVPEAEESVSQGRKERCTACSGRTDILAAIKNLPKGEVHTQESFEGCSSEKGCAGIKVKDGKLIEKFGNLEAFKAAAYADTSKEFQFHPAGSNVLNAELTDGGPFWWMKKNSPFKTGGATFEKFTQSSSFTSNGGADLLVNPFLNGDITKLGGGSDASGYSASASFGSGAKDLDISKNPFLNGGFTAQSAFGGGAAQSAFGGGAAQSAFEGGAAQSAFGGGSAQSAFSGAAGQGGYAGGASQNGFNSAAGQNGFAGGAQTSFNAFSSSNKFGESGYTGSSPTPFTASTAGSNVNLIQNTQKTSEYDYKQQQAQQSFNGLFQSGGNVQANQNAGGDFQQSCSGQGYACVSRAQCNNGVVSANAGVFQQKPFCNSRNEICCRIETISPAGAGSLGVGLATFNQGSSFSGSNQNTNFGASFGAGQTTGSGFDNSALGASNFKGTSVVSSLAPPRFGSTQSNFIDTDSYSAPSDTSNLVRPGASGLKPGVPYLPPIDTIPSNTNIVSTGYPATFVTTPRPFSTPRPVTTPRPFLTTRPIDSTIPDESQDNSLIREQFIRPELPRPELVNIPVGCAAALKCTPIEYCTAEGVVSNTTVVLTREQDVYRVPLTDCKDLETGRIGKCCRDPFYTDPWPTNQLGKWVNGVFGGNDGKYIGDSRVSSNNPRPQVTLRPDTTGSVIRPNFFTTPVAPITPGFPSSTPGPFIQQTQFGKGSFEQGGRGVVSIGGQGSQGQFGQGSQFSQTTSQFGQGQNRGVGQTVTQGVGSFGRGQVGIFGQGQTVTQGQGTLVSQGAGTRVTQGTRTLVNQGQGFGIQQDQGIGVTQGTGQIIRQGGGQTVTQGSRFGISGIQGQGVTQGTGVGVITEQGQGVIQNQGFRTQGQGVVQEFGQSVSQDFGVSRRQGAIISQGGQGQVVSQGAGSGVTTGQGQGVTQGFGIGSSKQGQVVTQGQGFGVNQGFGYGVIQGAGQGGIRGSGQTLIQNRGQNLIQGFGTGVQNGGGFTVTQGGGGVGVENDYSESVQRVFLQRYTGSGECGILNPQKPNGNPKEQEVDFAEIPWQAMILLQTNRSLLCGGVITRPDVVVTTASCVEGLDAKNVLIKGGEWKLGIDDEPLPFQIVQVKNILRHPFYKVGEYKYDAAILVLTENLRLAKNIWPICLPSASDNLDAFYNGAGDCIVTGWGKQVLQAHLSGSIMHSINVSLINPGGCEAKISQSYPHLLEQYDQDSCVCGQPTNPLNNLCRVDIGSALACTTGDSNYVFRGIYSWDSGCQAGNQLAIFYKFDLEWYEWAIGLTESVRFAKYGKVTKGKISSVKTTTFISGSEGGVTSGVKGFTTKGFGVGGVGQLGQFTAGLEGVSSTKGFGVEGQSQTGQFGLQGQTGQFSASQSGEIQSPISKTFTATYTEKKFFQTEPKFVTYTTKPEIVTFTTKPKYFTYTTKPEIVTYTTKPEIVTFTTKPEIVTYTTKPEIISYTTKPKYFTFTTKPQIIRYETSGTKTNPTYIEPGVDFKPSFSEIVGAKHTHDATCKCLENTKK